MYAIYAYIGVVWGVNVGIYGIHGVSGYSMFSSAFLCRLAQTPRLRMFNQIDDVHSSKLVSTRRLSPVLDAHTERSVR